MTSPDTIFTLLDYALSESELNYLVKILGATSGMIQQDIKEVKGYQQLAWIAADKDSPQGQQAFEDLNTMRNYLRDLKKRNKMLANILHKLKKQR
jgi:hypothetical protein